MKNSMLRNAITYGVLLCLITIIFGLISGLARTIIAVPLIIWFIKLAATITLFWYAIKKQSLENTTFTYGDAVSFGLLTGFISSILMAVYTIIQMTVISPDILDSILTQAQSTLDAQGSDFDLSSITKYFPLIIFFVCVFYYSLIGLIYSLIMGAFAKRENVNFDSIQSE